MPTVKLYASLRKQAGKKEVSVPGRTVGTVLDELAKQHPSLAGIILEKDELRPHVVVTLNGHNTSDVNAQVAEQDVIAVFPPIAGGS